MNKSTLRWLIIIATVVTALVHLALGLAGIFGGSPGGLDIAFVLNGLAYLTLLAALFFFTVPVLSANKRLTHYLLIALGAVTFILFFVFNWQHVLVGEVGPAAIVAKIADLTVVITTALHLKQA
jgi:hypothetical protein